MRVTVQEEVRDNSWPPPSEENHPQPLPEPSSPLSSRIWETSWPWLLKLISPILFLLRQVIALVIVINVRFLNDRRISPSAKCPACGCREVHDILYAPTYERVFHICKICKAEWAQSTILPVDRWRVTQLPRVEPPSDFIN